MTLDARAFKGLSRFLAPSAGGPVADRALAEKLISPAQLQQCLEEQERSGLPLDEILVALGFVPRVVVDRLRQPELPAEVVEAATDLKRVMGKYVLVSRAGQGGMAEVWKAWDRSLGRWVALKFLKDEVGQPEQRIEREGRMAGGLSHPGIISIYERGRHEDGRPYLVMPFVEGRALVAPLPPKEAARIVLEVARALEHVHAMKVIHRDVKPSNILLDAGGRIVLADFGLAIPAKSPAFRWSTSGTPEYASPEQVRGDVLDEATDVYSLGATLYHLLEGRPPFRGADPKEVVERVLTAPPPPLPSTPAALASIVRRAMERDRARRYRSMTEMAAALGKFLGAGGAPKGPTYRALAAVIVVGLLPWLGTYVYVLTQRADDERREIRAPLEEAREALDRAESLAAEEEPSPEAVREAARRALAFLRRAVGLAGKDFPEALVQMGRCYELLGQEGRARSAWDSAGGLPEARLGLGRTWLRRHLEGRREYDWREAALQDLRRAATGRPDDPSRALVLACEERWAEAVAVSAPARASRRSDDVFQLAMGIAAARAGSWEVAMEHFRQALRLRPHDATVYYHLAVAYEEKGETGEASAYYGAAIRGAPPGWNLLNDAKARLEKLR